MQVRVVGTERINVLAIQRVALEHYKKKERFQAYVVSSLAREHEFLMRLPPGTSWNLIIENPWNREIEINYTVTELIPV